MRVGASPVRIDRRTSSRLDRADPRDAMASNSAFRRSEGRRATLVASDRQPGASLCSTPSEHAAAGLRRHPGKEAMLALACALLGLIGPLHGCVPIPLMMSRGTGRSHTNGWPFSQPRSTNGAGVRFGLGFYQTSAQGCQTCPPRREPAAEPARRKRCPGRSRTATLRRLPRPDAPHHRGFRRPERVQLRPRREPLIRDWETAVDGCEPGLACRLG